MTDISITHSGQATLVRPAGRLDAKGAADLWKNLAGKDSASVKPQIILDMTGVDYMDTAGAATLLQLRSHFSDRRDSTLKIENIGPELNAVFQSVSDHLKDFSPRPGNDKGSVIEKAGKYTSVLLSDMKEFITFTGQITWAGFQSLKNPRQIRWTDTFIVAERAGVNALPIVALISFIVGLVMAFQAAIPMRMFGAELYVADLIGIAMVREMGPLMTAIVLAGRSASAFAAEIGTMKINEEIDALNVMGLEPVRFLIIPRIIAATFITPLLTIFSNLMGMVGGALVITSMGYPVISYYNQIASFVEWNDFAGGLLKCFVFGFLIAATGCIRGYQTSSGPSAVGVSTTRAVVSSIVLIAVFDGIFSVMYYYLGI